MIVRARRGGGIAGSALNQELGPLDTSELEDRDLAERIERAVEEGGFFDLPAELPGADPPVADAMWHSLEVEADYRRHEVSWEDGSEVPDGLAQLAAVLAEAPGAIWRDVEAEAAGGAASEPDCDWDAEAIHDWMPGKTPKLSLNGTCHFRTDGYKVELRRHEPQGFFPLDLLLDLVVTPPQDSAADVLDDVPVRYEEETDVRYTSVTILPGGPTIPVQHVS